METTYELHHKACTDRVCDSECLTKEDVIKYFFEADDKLESLKRIHKPHMFRRFRRTYCIECQLEWPCQTIQIVSQS